MDESTIDRCARIIKEIDIVLKNGEDVFYERRDRELSVVWNSSETLQEWRLGFNVLRALTRYKNDPRRVWIIAFMTGHVNATWAAKEITRLENLKVFW